MWIYRWWRAQEEVLKEGWALLKENFEKGRTSNEAILTRIDLILHQVWDLSKKVDALQGDQIQRDVDWVTFNLLEERVKFLEERVKVTGKILVVTSFMMLIAGGLVIYEIFFSR